jgi:hypothetical protein
MERVDYRQKIEDLLLHPDKLKVKKPFTRGMADDHSFVNRIDSKVDVGERISVSSPVLRRYVVPQEQFVRELDPNCHDVLFDDNIPSLCVKISKNDYRDVAYKKMAVPIQKEIKNKQTMHLAANPMQFTLMDTTPTDDLQENFITFKQYWNLRNQDGMKYKMVDTQKSYGDAGWLFYRDRHSQIKSRVLSFADGFVLCPHNDANGDRLLECVYYIIDDTEHLDCYDDKYLHRFERSLIDVDMNIDMSYDGWTRLKSEEHGFSEIPLITKRGDVAWNNVQPIIECYEELYNVFNAIQKRFGWGIFYVKGRFKDEGKKIAGGIVLQDTSMDGSGDAKFLTPPTPDGTIDTLNLMLESIQLGSSTTFLLPKDVKMSGDISGIAIMLTQSLDMENALQAVVEWQNVADKAVRLFKEGLAHELVATGENPTAITDFARMDINAKFKVWRPLNEYEYNQMLTILTGAGILSKESGIELNTASKPDEKMRIERQEARQREQDVQHAKPQESNVEPANEQ